MLTRHARFTAHAKIRENKQLPCGLKVHGRAPGGRLYIQLARLGSAPGTDAAEA